MFNCQNLLHPFQNDPGTSQRQRIIEQLLSETVKIDGRTLADLLDYFAKLSRGINYYNKDLAVSDWQPFFNDSLPFLLASVSKYDHQIISEKANYYKFLFDKGPSANGLQLIIHFIYQNTINKIYKWHDQINGEDIVLSSSIEELIRTKLAEPLKIFITLANAASKWFGIKRIDFSKFLDTAENNAWNINITKLHSVSNSFHNNTIGKCEQLKALYGEVMELFPAFLEGIKVLAVPASDSLQQSLVPLGKELEKNHAPHLAIIFSFIRLFQKMQDELNKKTKEHLTFFYTQVLRIKPREAEPDKANIIFEVQKIVQNQYQKYRVSKGTALNGGRDTSNADILFETDDEIIVNETKIAEVKTLFLNHETIYDGNFLEGVYIAPKADKADGIEKNFKDDDPKNWFTVGREISKYTEPGKKTPKPHPAGRLGFVLASPVLYLAEGKREVTITLDCEVASSCSAQELYSAANFYTMRVRDFLTDTATGIPKSYITISKQILAEAVTRGMTELIADKIRDRFLLRLNVFNLCTNVQLYRDFIQPEYSEWKAFINTPANANIKAEADKLPELFAEKFPVKIYFSGEKEWIAPSSIDKFELTTLNVSNQFVFKLVMQLDADKPAVTFYNKENLNEDIGTELPVSRIEIDDSLKIEYFLDSNVLPDCCLEKIIQNESHFVSLYHFFRSVKVNANTTIDVKVCGLKNFVVQNDENVMDVNSIVFPFGTRPKVGANFYISSKEIFCKNWKEIGVRFNWKDKPVKLDDYYHGYEDFLTGIDKTDFADNKYFYFPAFLQNGVWVPYAPIQKSLFTSDPTLICAAPLPTEQYYYFDKTNFGLTAYKRMPLTSFQKENFTNSTRDNFLRLSLFDPKGLAFQHSRYSFVLARQMMALGKWPQIYIGPVYDGIPNPPPIGNLPLLNIDEVFNAIMRSYEFATNIRERTDVLLTAIKAAFTAPAAVTPINISPANFRAILQNPLPIINPPVFNPLPNPLPPLVVPVPPNAPALNPFLLQSIIQQLEDVVLFPIYDKLKDLQDKRVVIPNEPYTPQIQNMSIDYKATALIDDIDLIHLYPFAGTYKKEEIELAPTLFPTCCEEGNLFIALKDLQPGTNLNMLFQMAEATADSEIKRDAENLKWYYLDSNVWKQLRTGFEVLEDGTLDLTTTGIIKFALPENMTKLNTVMPSNVYWIKAAVSKNSKSVSETISIHTQAIRATFKISPANDKGRLNQPLDPGTIAKLLVADPVVKKVDQPYQSFEGHLAELDSSYYLRVSELLRHKGRAIQKWDYERIALEKFPQIYKAKCINHSFQTDANKYENDVPYAPGYVVLALIPDLTKMNAGNSFEPKVPVSLLEKIEQYLIQRTSPFVRLKAANPRYEKVNFCLTVRLFHGKDPNYYTEKLKDDLREFMAPWAVGKYDKLTFGQCIYRSDILRFLERTGYVDFISELRMTHENKPALLFDQPQVCPLSPRSILVAGNVDVKIDPDACDSWCSRPEKNNECPGPVLVNDYCIDIIK